MASMLVFSNRFKSPELYEKREKLSVEVPLLWLMPSLFTTAFGFNGS